MAWIIVESRALSQEEMDNNAQEFANGMGARGFSSEAISGMLGNMQYESSINPGRWQGDVVGDYSAGFGLVQWTPATNYTDWATANGYQITDPYGQEEWIDTLTGQGQWGETSSYPISWDTYRTSSESPEYLASAFLYNFERPADPSATEAGRREAARYYYEKLNFTSCFTTPRLDDSGMLNNPYWYDLNPFYISGYGLPNCTCYCWGRRYEITGKAPDTSLGNADTWFDYAVSKGQRTGKEPKLGAIMCWSYTGSHASDGGHVAIVEEINDDGSITTSNSAYGGAYFYTQTLTSPYEWADYTNFEGCIYLDCEPTPKPPERKRKKMPLYFYLWP